MAPVLTSQRLDPTRLLFNLQRINQIMQQCTGCLDPMVIAQWVTDALVQEFDCAFARIWIIEPDGSALRLVASSGLHTRLDGSFARVPMGAFKVGKIAQNRVCFLSDNLPEEPWVKDREWALQHQLKGFAGYPLATPDKVIGVLALFSREPMAPEFLEVLVSLRTSLRVALDIASQCQTVQTSQLSSSLNLSDQLAQILGLTPLTLVGTEQPLALSFTQVLLRATEIFSRLKCASCQLTYGSESVTLEAILALPGNLDNWLQSAFDTLSRAAACLGGSLHTQPGADPRVLQTIVALPYFTATGPLVRIRCRQPVLQLAFTQLAHMAGLSVQHSSETHHSSEHLGLLITDEVSLARKRERVLWIRHDQHVQPQRIQACIDLSISPTELRAAVHQVEQGLSWGLDPTPQTQVTLSDREREMMTLLAEGLRDREIAHHLHISESTVKFHINNVVTKLKVRTRLQALYQMMKQGSLA